MRKLAVPIAAAISAVLAGCGGGGSSAPAAPSSNSTAPIQVSSDGSGVPVTMTFKIGRQGESATRSVQTISVPATTCPTAGSFCGMTVQAYAAGASTPPAPTALCGSTPTAGGCVADLFAQQNSSVTVTIIVPVGSDTFVVNLYANEPTQPTTGVYSVSGTPTTAQTTTTIALNATNTVNLAFAGPSGAAQPLPTAAVPAGGSVSGTVAVTVPANACSSTCGIGATTVALTIALSAQRRPQNGCTGSTAATSNAIFVFGVNLALTGVSALSFPLQIGATLYPTVGSTLAASLGPSGTFNVAYLLCGASYSDVGTVSYAYTSGTNTLNVIDTGASGATLPGTYIVYFNPTIGIPVIF